MVPAQVQFLHMTHLFNALWYCGDLLQTEVQTALFIKRQCYAVQGHIQRDGFAFTLLPLGGRTNVGLGLGLGQNHKQGQRQHSYHL